MLINNISFLYLIYMSCLGKKTEINFIKQYASRYKDIKNQIKPLDLVVFRGGEFVSTGIRILEELQVGNADWTHVGLVIDTSILPTIPNGKPDKLYVLESTMSGKLSGDKLCDVEGNGVFGVQIRDMEKLVKAYNASGNTLVGWCRLKNNPCERRSDESFDDYEDRMSNIRKDFSEIYERYGHRSYDYNLISLASSLFPQFRCIRKKWINTNDKLFCSELVALVYCKLGILDEEKFNPADVVPVDFTSGLDNDGIVPFHKLPPKILI